MYAGDHGSESGASLLCPTKEKIPALADYRIQLLERFY